MLQLLSPVDRHAFLDGLQHPQICQQLLRDGERLVGEDHEVGQFADFDLALRVFLEVLPGRPDGHGLECRLDRNPLLRAENSAAMSGASHRGGEICYKEGAGPS